MVDVRGRILRFYRNWMKICDIMNKTISSEMKVQVSERIAFIISGKDKYCAFQLSAGYFQISVWNSFRIW